MWLGVSVILPPSYGVILNARDFTSARKSLSLRCQAKESRAERPRAQSARDPSLRLKSGYAQDDAIE